METGEGGGASGCVVDPNMKAQENRIVPPKCLWIQLQQTGNLVRWVDKQTDTEQDRDIMCTVTDDRYYKKRISKHIWIRKYEGKWIEDKEKASEMFETCNL